MRTVHVVGAAVIDAGRCLAAQRGPGMSLAGRWEFPGGKVESGETAPGALARELREELGIDARIGAWLGSGDAVAGGQRVCLDVYAAAAGARAVTLHEHAAVSWLGSDGLYARDWAAPDVPVLPAVHAAIDPYDDACCVDPLTLVAADWSDRIEARAVWCAEFEGRWTIRRLTRSGGWTFTALLEVAGAVRNRTQRAVLVALDASLGVPAALAFRLGRERFPEVLEHLGRSGGLNVESPSAAGWRPDAPFFRIPPGAGAKLAFFEAAGGYSMLLRHIERCTRANPTFALSGIPGTVGSGTRALWRELLEARDRGPDLSLWPFDGTLAGLVRDRALIVGETYPRMAYAAAMADVLPAPPTSLAKTRGDTRASALRRLGGCRWVAESGVRLGDLEAAAASEDDFDALMCVAALTRAQIEGRPLAGGPIDARAEGGLLGSGGITLRAAPWLR